MAVQGIFTSNQGIVGDRVGDFSSAVLQIYPTGTALMLALSSGMQKKAAGDTIFNWYEDAHISGRSAITGGGLTTAVTVADTSNWVPGSILMVEETGEYMLVTALAGLTVTVIRGLAGTAITSVSNGMNFYAVGNAREEASGLPTAVTQSGHPRLNYTQIFRNGWAISGTAKAIKFQTGNRTAKNKADCGMYHAEDMEKAMLWGKKHLGQLNGKQFRMTDGIVTQIEQYGGVVATAASKVNGNATPGYLSLADFNEWMRQVFKRQIKGQPNERIAIGGDQVVAVINRCVQLDSVYQITQGESKVGISVWTIVCPFGTLKLMTHPLMNESPYWASQLYALHPGGIAKRVLRDTFNEDYDNNGNRIVGKDADEGAMTTEMGIEVGGAATMGIMRNITAAVKSS